MTVEIVIFDECRTQIFEMILHQLLRRPHRDLLIRVGKPLAHGDLYPGKPVFHQLLAHGVHAVLPAQQHKYRRMTVHAGHQIAGSSMEAHRAHLLVIHMQPGCQIGQAGNARQNRQVRIQRQQCLPQLRRAAVKSRISGQQNADMLKFRVFLQISLHLVRLVACPQLAGIAPGAVQHPLRADAHVRLDDGLFYRSGHHLLTARTDARQRDVAASTNVIKFFQIVIDLGQGIPFLPGRSSHHNELRPRLSGSPHFFIETALPAALLGHHPFGVGLM